jgi:hypothetical protein
LLALISLPFPPPPPPPPLQLATRSSCSFILSRVGSSLVSRSTLRSVSPQTEACRKKRPGALLETRLHACSHTHVLTHTCALTHALSLSHTRSLSHTCSLTYARSPTYARSLTHTLALIRSHTLAYARTQTRIALPRSRTHTRPLFQRHH